MKGGWIYILTNKPNGTLYIGVTSHLTRRIHEHKAIETGSFVSRYKLHRLVYYEEFDDIISAIQREKNLKHWPRAWKIWKIRLIHAHNPNWRDLSFELI